jgi:hypothetical protein
MPVVPPIQPGPNPTELNIQRLNTNAFIAANPIAVTLIPRAKVLGGTGVKWQEGSPRPLQVARLIDTGDRSAQPAQDGVQRKDLFQLLLPFDGEVALDDYWVAAGLRYEVTSILPYNGYERRAEVTRYGTEGQPVY